MTKHFFRFTLILLACLSIRLTATAQIVNIPDRNLRAEIETTLGKRSGATITTADMAGLTRLDAPNANISNLTGLEYAINLTGLYLGHEYVSGQGFINSNSVLNLSPVSGLTNLTRLSLSNNNITNISSLSGLTNLTWLSLSDNNITNISSLSGLTNLTHLYLDNNNILNISALSGLIELRDLHLWTNNISDLSAVSGLTNLIGLVLHNNSISDLSAVSGLTNLTGLSLYKNSISDLSSLSGLTNLTVLYLHYNRISDLTPLVSNTGLGSGDEVDVRGNPLNAAAFNTHIPTLQSRGVDVQFDAPRQVNIPDRNLRAAIEKELSKASGAAITTADMATLTGLNAPSANISNLTGLEHAINLAYLRLSENNITNISAVSGLTNLTALWLHNNSISDISPVRGLTNLIHLSFEKNPISDISAVSGLTNLEVLYLIAINISDISAVSGLTKLKLLHLAGNSISDISAVSGLTNLAELYLGANNISDLSPLVSNTGLGSGDKVYVRRNPLNAAAFNTHIPTLQRRGVTVEFDAPRPVNIPDPGLRAKIEKALGKASGAAITTADMATLTGLLDAQTANIRNLTGLGHATNLTQLLLNVNHISDISAVSGLTNLTSLYLGYNSSISDISAVSGLTNLRVLDLRSNSVSDISAVLGLTNLRSLYLNNNNISDLSPLVSNRGLGSGDTVEVKGNPLSAVSINTHIPTLQRRGVKVEFDKAPSTNATVSVFPSPVESPGIGGQLTVSLKVENGVNVAGYQATVAFDASVLRYKESTNGDYLPAGAFFVTPNVSGNQVPLAATALSGESSGNGTLATLMFEVVAVKASTLTLSDVVLSDGAGVGFQPQITNGEIVEPRGVKGDVNGDGVVNIQDLVLAAQRLGQRGQNDADMNGDGVVNIQDLVLVAGAFGNTGAAPALHPQDLAPLTAADVQDWLTEAEQISLSTPAHRRGIVVLEQLLSVLTPKETALLPNYPNPFNPETWIPYHVAEPADVQITIYDIHGAVVRQLELGYQPAGYYTERTKAAYWDGRNASGESVASGVYFYQFRADDYSHVRRMVIVK